MQCSSSCPDPITLTAHRAADLRACGLYRPPKRQLAVMMMAVAAGNRLQPAIRLFCLALNFILKHECDWVPALRLRELYSNVKSSTKEHNLMALDDTTTNRARLLLALQVVRAGLTYHQVPTGLQQYIDLQLEAHLAEPSLPRFGLLTTPVGIGKGSK